MLLPRETRLGLEVIDSAPLCEDEASGLVGELLAQELLPQQGTAVAIAASERLRGDRPEFGEREIIWKLPRHSIFHDSDESMAPATSCPTVLVAKNTFAVWRAPPTAAFNVCKHAGSTRRARSMRLRRPMSSPEGALNGSALWNMAQELRDVLPLHVLDEAEGEELFSQLRCRRFAAGEIVYHRGDLGTDTFVVHDGVVKSLLHDEQGRELLIGRHARGEFFGTLALFKPGPRESSAVAQVRTTALQIRREGALKVLGRNPEATSFLFARMAETIEQLALQVEAIAFLDVRSRLARYLMDDRGFGAAGFRQEDIAAAVGANIYTVNKTLRDFARRNLVTVERRRVHILDEAQLRLEIRP